MRLRGGDKSGRISNSHAVVHRFSKSKAPVLITRRRRREFAAMKLASGNKRKRILSRVTARQICCDRCSPESKTRLKRSFLREFGRIKKGRRIFSSALFG